MLEEIPEDVTNKKVKLVCVADFAHFVRYILPLSTDSEMYYERLSKKDKEAVDWAYSLYRYSSTYDFIPSNSTNIDL